MLTKEDARKLIKSSLPDNIDILDEYTLEKEYGWVFFPESKRYIESRNLKHRLIGSGGTLVEKASGKIHQFGSGFGLTENLKIYELGYFKYDVWDIVINAVFNEQETIEYLSKLRMQYIVPEQAYGETWAIPKSYTTKQIKLKLQRLPIRFCIGTIYFQWKIFESFKEQNAFTYELIGNTGYRNNP